MKNMESGFTLAEVLVTLMIIGVIASVTIPGLRRSAEERELAAGAKKAYATAANVVSRIEIDNGPVKRWNWSNKEAIAKSFTDNMNVTKYCGNTGNCFGQAYTVYRTDKTLYFDYNIPRSDYRIWTTADGAIWVYSDHGEGCNSGNAGHNNSCAALVVDVNGIRKPNTIGIDLYAFTVTPEGVFAFGGVPGGSMNDPDQCMVGNGWNCTARVLKEGKISY